ncbi:glycosyltransferase [Wenyingzhuangia gilva]|nr:glycosyltransferase [Wenyingzhuangia sp. chi5]
MSMKIALVENFGADFVGARLRYAVFLKNKGFEVYAIIPKDGHKMLIKREKINVIEVEDSIRDKGIKSKIKYASELRGILKKENFDIVHFYRLQPNLIGTFIAGLYTSSKIVNHITGLGVVFSSNNTKSKILQLVIKLLYKLNNYCFKPYTVFQNKEDIQELGFKERVYCIEGSAVNEDRFNDQSNLNNIKKINELREQLKISKESKIIVFVSRLLKEKGVLELVKAVIKVNENYAPPISLVVVGWSDIQNPSAVNPKDLEELAKEFDYINFLGKRSDIEVVIGMGDVSILPTYYREGTPRFLLESMAVGKPIITTDMPGCNHLIDKENMNGFLIKPRNVEAIQKAIVEVLKSDIDVLGKNSQKLYKEKFSEDKVYSALLNIYTSIVE